MRCCFRTDHLCGRGTDSFLMPGGKVRSIQCKSCEHECGYADLEREVDLDETDDNLAKLVCPECGGDHFATLDEAVDWDPSEDEDIDE